MGKKYKELLTVTILLTLVGLFGTITVLLEGVSLFPEISNLAVFALVIYYTTDGYKKPHGNMLRWIMLIYAASLVFVLNRVLKGNNVPSTIIIPVIMMLTSYMAGRLNKIEKNRYLSVIILLLHCHVAVMAIVKGGNTNPVVIVSILSEVILWIDLCAAYFLRYALHKEAGFLDKQ